MNDIDLTALRTAAKGATPGRWQTVYGEVVWIHDTMIARADSQQDGRYIATANPAVVLALLDRLAVAEAAVAEATGAADVRFHDGFSEGYADGMSDARSES